VVVKHFSQNFKKVVLLISVSENKRRPKESP